MKSKSSSAKGYSEFSLLYVDMSWLCRQSNTTKKVCSNSQLDLSSFSVARGQNRLKWFW